MNTQLLNSKIIYFRPKFALPNFLILKVGFIIIGVIISEVAVPSVISVDGSDVVDSSWPRCYQPLKVPAFLSGTTAASMVGGVRDFS